MPAHDAYVICTSPRSGSTLLCNLLVATGIAGQPASYFHNPSVKSWMGQFDMVPDPAADDVANLRTVFGAVLERGRDGSPMFGLRLQRHSFAFFIQQLRLLHPTAESDPHRFRAAFGRVLFIHLTRRDKVEQAVSYVKAQQTGLWHKAADGRELERQKPPSDPIYDKTLIAETVKTMTAFDHDWTTWFDAEQITPLQITYGALSHDPIGSLATVLRALGVDPHAARGITPSVQKLADSTSQKWVHRFRSETAI
jgi:LPS sulfotransferase NodH